MRYRNCKPNHPCLCGSGVKFKRCCGPRGGLTEVELAEEEAYHEARRRKPMSPEAAALFPMMLEMAAQTYRR